MPLRLLDTLSRDSRPLTPLDGKTLRFYCCGPTVYGPAHIGNFRTFTAQDVFRRVVELGGTPTLHIRNITDVDDKTIRDSQKAGQTLTDFTRFWTEKFHSDCAALNLLPPHVEPSAVTHIPHQIRMIETLVERGHAYTTSDGSVYFRVASFKDYGRLSHLEDRELKLGASESASALDNDEYSKDALADFALWKARKPEDGTNYWPSPWGEGRPGWHLECSAMILEYLGEDFDLHSGGVDLVFPHHENEIAQSCCATHGHFARHWFHITHLMVDGGKMSKSLGNLYTLADLAAKGYTAAEVRYVLVGAHYRQPLNFTFHSLDAARQALQKLAKAERALHQAAGSPAPLSHSDLIARDPGPFTDAWTTLNDDLNVPGALGAIFSTLNKTKPAQLSQPEALTTWTSLHLLLDALGLTLPTPADESLNSIVILDTKLAFEQLGKGIADFYSPSTLQISTDVVPFVLNPGFEHILNQPELTNAISLSAQRWQAKQARDWSTSDTLRKELEAAGWLVKDAKDSYQILPK